MRNERSHHADRRRGGGAKNNVTHNGLCQISTKERERGSTREMKPCRVISTRW